MTSEFLTLNLQDLESLIAKGSCLCHIINPNKTRIILWKQIQKDGSELYYLRIGIQKFISYPLKDKNSEIYWRFNCCFEAQTKVEEKEVVNTAELSQTQETITNPDPNNPVTKYQQRLAKTSAINHGKSNSTTNSSEHSESVSH